MFARKKQTREKQNVRTTYARHQLELAFGRPQVFVHRSAIAHDRVKEIAVVYSVEVERCHRLARVTICTDVLCEANVLFSKLLSQRVAQAAPRQQVPPRRRAANCRASIVRAVQQAHQVQKVHVARRVPNDECTDVLLKLAE